MAEPTIIEIHNYARGSPGPQKEGPEGREIGRFTNEGEWLSWSWNPGVTVQADFHDGKTYVLYEIDADE